VEPLPITTASQLLQLNEAQLDSLYQQGAVAAIPPGRVRGTAILAPGRSRNRFLARGARLIWQGKVIGEQGNAAVNRFFGFRIIKGEIYQGASWLDGQPSLILDYVRTSRLYAKSRDEIRQIAPGLFLGYMYDRTTSPPTLQMRFALEIEPDMK
jgi:hypothetical protein